MRYRILGNTGLNGSIIGLGAEYLDRKPYETVKETIDAAIEYGMNIMDVFMPGDDVRKKIGKAIKGNRDKFFIQGHIGSTDVNQQYDISRDIKLCKEYFEALLRNLETDYIDFGMLFYLDTEESFEAVFNSEIVEYALKLKEEGKIRHIGASSHNPVIAKKVVETGVVELLMFSINPAFDMIPAEIDALSFMSDDFDKKVMLKMDPKRYELYMTCEKLKIPITVMKTLGGGKLISPSHSPFSKILSINQCIHYALTRPAVASVLLGCQSRKEVEQAISYLNASSQEVDFAEHIKSMNKDFKGSCVYCNHCLPCPVNIDIAAVTKYLDIALIDVNAKDMGAGQHYRALSANASDCIKCGRCEVKCPFSVPVIGNMEKAVKIFG